MSECQPSLVGIWRVSEDGFTYDQAYKEMRRYYFGPQFKQLSGAVKARQTPSWNCISDGLYLVYGVTGEANSPANWNSVFAELVIDTEIDLTLVYSGRKWPWFPAENGRDFRSKMAMDSGPKWPISERINTKPIAYANHMQLA